MYELNENGFLIKGTQGSVRIRIATVATNYSKLDPAIHLPLKVLENHAAAIKHVYVEFENRTQMYHTFLILMNITISKCVGWIDSKSESIIDSNKEFCFGFGVIFLIIKQNSKLQFLCTLSFIKKSSL